MKTKMVRYTRETMPRISEERRAELRALAERPDSEIDLSDIPEWTEEDFKNAVRGRFYRPDERKLSPASSPASTNGAKSGTKVNYK
jgi:hypothetical protein